MRKYLATYCLYVALAMVVNFMTPGFATAKCGDGRPDRDRTALARHACAVAVIAVPPMRNNRQRQVTDYGDLPLPVPLNSVRFLPLTLAKLWQGGDRRSLQSTPWLQYARHGQGGWL